MELCHSNKSHILWPTQNLSLSFISQQFFLFSYCSSYISQTLAVISFSPWIKYRGFLPVFRISLCITNLHAALLVPLHYSNSFFSLFSLYLHLLILSVMFRIKFIIKNSRPRAFNRHLKLLKNSHRRLTREFLCCRFGFIIFWGERRRVWCLLCTCDYFLLKRKKISSGDITNNNYNNDCSFNNNYLSQAIFLCPAVKAWH